QSRHDSSVAGREPSSLRRGGPRRRASGVVGRIPRLVLQDRRPDGAPSDRLLARFPSRAPHSDRHSNRGQESPSGEPGSSNPETSDFLELPRLTASYGPPATGMAIAGKTVALCAFWSSTTIRLSARSLES